MRERDGPLETSGPMGRLSCEVVRSGNTCEEDGPYRSLHGLGGGIQCSGITGGIGTTSKLSRDG